MPSTSPSLRSSGASSTTALLLLLHTVGAVLLVTKQMEDVLMVEVVEDVDTYWSNIWPDLSPPTPIPHIARKIVHTPCIVLAPYYRLSAPRFVAFILLEKCAHSLPHFPCQAAVIVQKLV